MKDKKKIWMIIFTVCSFLATIIDKIDPLASVNFLAFVQYFVLGIVASKVCNFRQKSKIILLLIVPFAVYFLNDHGLAKNLIFAILYSFILSVFKNKWNSYESKIICKMVNGIDGCTYAIYLIHPIFIDLLGTYTMKQGLSIGIQISMFFACTIIVVLIMNAIEKKIVTRLKTIMGI